MHAGRIVYTHCNVLDGTENMKLIPDAAVLTEGGIICSVEAHGKAPKGCRQEDLGGRYLIPGLINIHCHLAGNGKPQKIDAGTADLIQEQLKNPIGRRIMKKMIADSAKTALLSGTTTVRAVGGLSSFDAEVRDEIAKGKRTGPRILAANQAISVPGGHMAGTLALIAHSKEEAVSMVDDIALGRPDLIKLMITGGTLDIEKPGDEGKVLMTPEEIRAAAARAHQLGYKVAAHVQSAKGMRAALEGGVDTIEHGGMLDDSLSELFRKRHAALISTITPTAIMACLPAEISGLPKLYKDSCELYMQQIIPGFQRAVREKIPIGLGIDDGSPYVTHYCMWRELDFFTRYIGTPPEYALWRAAEGNAQIAGIGDITGTITPGKASDLLAVDGDPRSDFSVLSRPYLVVKGSKLYRHPKCRRYPEIDRIVDLVKNYDAAFAVNF